LPWRRAVSYVFTPQNICGLVETKVARPEITGRRAFATSEPSKTIFEFCQAERISRSKYYELKNKGLGPDETRVDGIIRIVPESHARWRRRHTKRT
jgi:hypothetical protein